MLKGQTELFVGWVGGVVSKTFYLASLVLVQKPFKRMQSEILQEKNIWPLILGSFVLFRSIRVSFNQFSLTGRKYNL